MPHHKKPLPRAARRAEIGPSCAIHDKIGTIMSLAAVADPLPLTTDSTGVIRVGGTRVTLDTIVYSFQEGATAEEILQQYPSLELPDIYAVIGYYLRHREDVDEYLAQREQYAAEVRKNFEARSDVTEFRERLLKRQAQNTQ